MYQYNFSSRAKPTVGFLTNEYVTVYKEKKELDWKRLFSQV